MNSDPPRNSFVSRLLIALREFGFANRSLNTSTATVLSTRAAIRFEASRLALTARYLKVIDELMPLSNSMLFVS